MFDVAIEFMKQAIQCLPVFIPLVLVINLVSDLLWR